MVHCNCPEQFLLCFITKLIDSKWLLNSFSLATDSFLRPFRSLRGLKGLNFFFMCIVEIHDLSEQLWADGQYFCQMSIVKIGIVSSLLTPEKLCAN